MKLTATNQYMSVSIDDFKEDHTIEEFLSAVESLMQGLGYLVKYGEIQHVPEETDSVLG